MFATYFYVLFYSIGIYIGGTSVIKKTPTQVIVEEIGVKSEIKTDVVGEEQVIVIVKYSSENYLHFFREC